MSTGGNENEIYKRVLYGLIYFFMNSIVKHIPCWWLRKMFYRLAGMQIGNSVILCNVETEGWWNIKIGDGVCINSFCHINGRGGLLIGDNVSISVYTKILSVSKDKDSSDFRSVKKPVVIESRVWTGINSVILPGSILKEGCILAAGSVAIGKEYAAYKVYSGVPAKYICDRGSDLQYDLTWRPWFR